MLERIDDQRKKAVKIMLQKGRTVEETAEWFSMGKDTVRAIRDLVPPVTKEEEKEIDKVKAEWDETTRKIREAAGWEVNDEQERNCGN